jgi:ligand-binding sensor domain-containing protein
LIVVSNFLRFLSLLILTCGPLFAQEYSFRTLGNSEGLKNLAVRQIYQDRIGFIWVSTENGIFRYDGDRFDEFGPAQGIPVTSGAVFGEAPDGSLLAGGSFGLYNLRDGNFQKLSLPFKSVSWAEGIQSDGKGHTFLGTDSGLIQLYSNSGRDGFAVRVFPQPAATSDPAVGGILLDGDVVWYGCGQELCRKDANGTRVLGRDSGLPGRALLVIRKDRDGNIAGSNQCWGYRPMFQFVLLVAQPAVQWVAAQSTPSYVQLPDVGPFLLLPTTT